MATSMTLAQFLTGAPTARTESGGDPVFGTLAVDAAKFSSVRYEAPEGYVCRELRGPKMRTATGVFDEFAPAFQFPYYFGENKDAFDECLRDLDDFVGRAPGYLVVVREASHLLADQPTQLPWFTTAMRDTAAYWAKRDVVYRVILQGAPRSVDAVSLTL
ncbi:barstar family protein [Nocardia transvalensis]|uniref:barstar family protein n=1 Tax=Nocardia transvalensis TaxID=37333 RepID=UPI001894F06D|nr:barstar family protein [Nocardia transvalensis]MBF6327378.1 barstar family protein [Nocardia transvalensis]